MLATSLATVPKSFQNDTFWDIKVGEYIVNHGIPQTDPFSIHTSLRYIPQHWLLDILIYYTYIIAGFTGLRLLLLFWTCLIFFLFYITCLKVSSNRILSLVFSVLALYWLGGFEFITLRAQVFGYAIFIFEIYCIESFFRSGKKIWLFVLPLLSFILINIQMGTWPFYFIIFLPYLANLVRIKLGRLSYEDNPRIKVLILPVIAGILAGFLNPFGIEGLVFWYKTLSESVIVNNINEMLSASFKSPLGMSVFFIMTFTIVIYLLTVRTIKLHHFLMILGTALMALQSVRHISLFVITSLIFVTQYVSELLNELNIKFNEMFTKPSRLKTAILIFFIIIPAINFIDLSSYVDEKKYPVAATEFIKEKIDVSDMRLYNQYTFGSYLMLNDIKVFIDSRADLYTSSFNPGVTILEDALESANVHIYHREIFNKYNLNYALVYADHPITIALSNDPGFTKIYDDESFILFKRNYK